MPCSIPVQHSRPLLVLALLLSASGALAQTIRGTVFPPRNASVTVTQGGRSTTTAVNSNSGEWSLQLRGSGPFQVRAHSANATICDPPFRAGAAVDTANLDFSLLSSIDWKQTYGTVRQNGQGVGGITIAAKDRRRETKHKTSDGGQGEMPRGMYNVTYKRFSPIGILTLTPDPSSAGIARFSPSSRNVNGDFSHKSVDFEIPGSSPTQPNPPQPSPPPAPITHTLSGIVTDEQGNPLGNVKIFGGPNGNTTTDASGRYQISGLADGSRVGVGPVYSPYFFTPQSKLIENISANHTQNFVGKPLNGPPILSIQPQDTTVRQNYRAKLRVHYINAVAGADSGSVVPQRHCDAGSNFDLS